MVDDIRITLKVDKKTVQNLHRFGFTPKGIAKSAGTAYPPTDTQIKVVQLFSSDRIFEVTPVYPLAPEGTVKEMFNWRIEEPNETSYDFFVRFRGTTTREQKEAIMMELAASDLVCIVKDLFYGRC